MVGVKRHHGMNGGDVWCVLDAGVNPELKRTESMSCLLVCVRDGYCVTTNLTKSQKNEASVVKVCSIF